MKNSFRRSEVLFQHDNCLHISNEKLYMCKKDLKYLYRKNDRDDDGRLRLESVAYILDMSTEMIFSIKQ